MSNSLERLQKECLNCNTTVQGRYCHVCGQENAEVKQGFLTIVKHFISDILHFDGKFFKTFFLLIKSPGIVAKHYASGRKATYLDPIRMYLFISTFVFFLLPIFNSIQDTLKNIHIIASPTERLKEASRYYALHQADPADQEAIKRLSLLLDTSLHLQLSKRGNEDNTSNSFDFRIDGKPFKATPIKEEKLFPEGNWFQNRVAKNTKTKFKDLGGDFNMLMLDQAQTQQKLMPYILFLSLPLFTMILTLLYRKKPGVYYSDNAAFTLYHYILVFGLLGVALIFQLLLKLFGVNTSLIFLPIIVITSIHLLFQMKKFYTESWIKTIAKFLLLLVFTSLLIALLFILVSLLILII